MICKSINYQLSTDKAITVSVPVNVMERTDDILRSKKSKRKNKKLTKFAKEILQHNTEGRLNDCATKDLLVLNLTYNYHIKNNNFTQSKEIKQLTIDIFATSMFELIS